MVLCIDIHINPNPNQFNQFNSIQSTTQSIDHIYYCHTNSTNIIKYSGNPEKCFCPPDRLAELLNLIRREEISGKAGKEVLDQIFERGLALRTSQEEAGEGGEDERPKNELVVHTQLDPAQIVDDLVRDR